MIPDSPHPVHSSWQDVLSAALIGTGRRTVTAVPSISQAAPGAVGELLEQIPCESPEQALLVSAAVLSSYRRAGTLPARSSGWRIPPCPPDTLPRCNPAAGRRLAAMVAGDRQALIPEWLRLANRTGLRIPEELLPEMLDYTKKHPHLVALLLPCLGERGHWLAWFNPDWSYALAAFAGSSAPLTELETAWQTGLRQDRMWMLRFLRKRDPAAARQLIELTWNEDNAAERAAFLAELEPGVSMEDEPFLEGCLDNRSVEVRRAAAKLLAKLPASRFVERQTRRLESLVAYKPGQWPLRVNRLEITLPETCDDEMKRDAIEDRPSQGAGQKSRWLESMLSAVPPGTWSSKWQKDARDLIRMANDSEWKEQLLGSWLTATANHGDIEWAEALWSLGRDLRDLYLVLPANRKETILIDLIQDNRITAALDLAVSSGVVLGANASKILIERFKKYYLGKPDLHMDYNFRKVIEEMETTLDPSCTGLASRTLARQAETDSSWERAVARLLDTLEFRQQMLNELQPSKEREE